MAQAPPIKLHIPCRVAGDLCAEQVFNTAARPHSRHYLRTRWSAAVYLLTDTADPESTAIMPPRPINGISAARETEDETLTRISTEGRHAPSFVRLPT